GEASKVAMVALGVFYPMIINTTAGVLEIDRIYLDVGKNFGRAVADLPDDCPARRGALDHGRGQARRRSRPRADRDRRDGRRAERYRLHDLERMEAYGGRYDVCRPDRHRPARLRLQLGARRDRTLAPAVESAGLINS